MKGFFSFEQLSGEYALLGRDVEHGVPTACYGLSDAQKYLIGALPSRRVVYVSADALTAKRAKESIAALSGKRCALLAALHAFRTHACNCAQVTSSATTTARSRTTSGYLGRAWKVMSFMSEL